MCKMFEVVTGRKSKGSVDKLEGLTKAYTDIHEDIAIIRIPVELMEVDSRYQTDERTERDLKYLTNNWDERKLMPLLGVPHWEEGKVYIVDGYGRWIASQIVDKDKYKDLKVQLILNAPTEDSERVAFEAELYAFQGVSVRKVTPIQKHGAMLVLHDPATETLEKMKNIYGFEYREVMDVVIANYGHDITEKQFDKALKEFMDMRIEDMKENLILCKANMLKEIRKAG